MMEKNKTLIIFTDSGDTIIDEASQVYDAQEPGIVSRAEFIENAGEILQQLHEEGYTIALVADGEEASFQNVYRKSGLRSCFDAWDSFGNGGTAEAGGNYVSDSHGTAGTGGKG